MPTFYVRPDTSHSATRNGLTYATAWGGWAEMVAAASSLTAGSDVFVCGAHLYSANISIPNHLGNTLSRVWFHGGYPGDPGSVLFTATNLFLQVARANTLISDLTIGRVFHSGSGSNTAYAGINFTPAGTAIGLTFFANTGEFHSDLLVFNCDFTQTSTGVVGAAAIQYFSSAAQRSTMTRCQIVSNRFTDFVTGRAIIHFRSQGDSDPLTRMQDIIVEGNTFTRTAGLCVEMTSPGNPLKRGNSAGLMVRNNKFRDTLEALSPNQATGGAIAVSGFANSTTPGFGVNLVEGNDARNVQGANGFIDLFYGTYITRYNYGDTFYSTTIDANGILFDLGCVDCVAYGNVVINILGKPAQGNSGCGIMILDSCTNVRAYGNIFVNMLTGLYYGVSGEDPDSTIEDNVFLNVKSTAIYASGSTPGLNTAKVRRNYFTGVGFRVRNQSGVTWVNEDRNYFLGFDTGNVGHTNGSRTVLGAIRNITAILNDAASFRPVAGAPGFSCGQYVMTLLDETMRPFDVPVSSDTYTFTA